MSRYEVMQAEYKAVTGENPSNFIRDELPVESVSWLDGLPTEAEWEYACRRNRWLAADASMGEALSVHYSGGSTLNDDIATWFETNGL